MSQFCLANYRIPRQRAYRAARGFTLIEVLVALLVFAFGVLGVVALQARSLQFSVQAEDRARAALLANEIITQMWVQSTRTPSSSVLTAWQSRVSDTTVAGLPGGAGTVSTADTNGVVSVTVTWRPPARKSSEPDYKLVTKVTMP